MPFTLLFTLLNHLPFSAQKFAIPLYTLFHKQPDYKSLKVFGCTCYPHLHPYNYHKLQFGLLSAFSWVTLPPIRAMKCLDPSGRLFLCRDVVFAAEHLSRTESLPSTASSTVDPDSSPNSSQPSPQICYSSKVKTLTPRKFVPSLA